MKFNTFIETVRGCNAEKVRSILASSKFNPAGMNNVIIDITITDSSVDVLEVLLEDERFDPTAMNNNAIFLALKNRKKEHFISLMKNKKVFSSISKDWIEKNVKNEEYKKLALDTFNVYHF